MAVRIKDVSGDGAFFMRGDRLLSINGSEVNDQLDVIYLTSALKGKVLFEINRNGKILSKRISMEEYRREGLELERMKFKRCRSKCIFCFVDQMPKGMRHSLYFKDDDYRLSFLFGNYVTLNDIKEEEIERIIEYHLSPLYVSVHAVDKDVRKRLFGRRIKHDIVELLRRLADNGISFHAQIVLVPGINDGAVLDETADTLFSLHPACQSLSVVPVGLTRHRNGLTDIRSIDEKEASALIQWAKVKGDNYKEKSGQNKRFVYLSDEIYLLADEMLPEEEDYDGYPQLSNGVGMCRSFINELEYDLRELEWQVSECRFAVITGYLGYSFFEKYVKQIIERKAPWINPHYIRVANRLFGESVTVSGLLSGRDIIEGAREHERFDTYVIPPNSLNSEGKFLDDLDVDDLSKALGAQVVVPQETFTEKVVLQACRRSKKL